MIKIAIIYSVSYNELISYNQLKHKAKIIIKKKKHNFFFKEEIQNEHTFGGNLNLQIIIIKCFIF